MEDDTETLKQSIEQYETQLLQIKQAISCAQSEDDKENLYALEKDIKELISLTNETLNSLKKPSGNDSKSVSETELEDSFSQEYALFKAQLAELESNSPVENSDIHDANNTNNADHSNTSQELQDDLDALKGSKCQAPHRQQWGNKSYHNALIMDVETMDSIEDMTHIQVRVMFVNPTEKDMLPCPYYLDGACRFTDEKCNYSHGELVSLSEIKEFREPDFSLIKEGVQVLAKQEGNLWHRAKVKEILNDTRCTVQFESKGRETIELDLHDLLPLYRGQETDDITSSSDSDEDDVPPQEFFVEMSLLRTPPNSKLGAWEKHTKGIGSRLMANMGYVIGCGLGKHGEGRLEPMEAMAYPPGKSLDACMALREAAGGDQDMFKAEQRQKKQQQQLLRLQKRLKDRQSRRKDVFTFINSKLSGTSVPKPNSSQQSLASSSTKGLNVERFRLGEDIKKREKDVEKFKESLKRHEKGSMTYKAIKSKLEEAQTELTILHKNDKLVAREQNQRDDRKKMAVF